MRPHDVMWCCCEWGINVWSNDASMHSPPCSTRQSHTFLKFLTNSNKRYWILSEKIPFVYIWKKKKLLTIHVLNVLNLLENSKKSNEWMLISPWVKFVTLSFPVVIFKFSQKAYFTSHIENENSYGKEKLWNFLKYHKKYKDKFQNRTHIQMNRCKVNFDPEYIYA